jgi:hypothetical protein
VQGAPVGIVDDAVYEGAEDVSCFRLNCGSDAVAFVTSDTKGIPTASLSVRVDPSFGSRH